MSCDSCWPGNCTGICKREATVRDIPDEELLRRAVRNARKFGTRGKHPRWVAVMDAFALGSTYANQLCQRFGFDPDEKVP